MDLTDKFTYSSHVANIPDIPTILHRRIFLLHNPSVARSFTSARGVSGTLTKVPSPPKKDAFKHLP